MAETQAEFLNIELMSYTIAVAGSYLVVVGQMLVNLTDVILGRISVVDAFLQFDIVTIVIKQDGLGWLSVAARTSSLLKVGFYGVGSIIVNHQSDVGLVDTHTKGVGSYHDTYAIVLPFTLATVFVGMIQSCMIES